MANPQHVSRRSLLAVSALGAAGSLLAACGAAGGTGAPGEKPLQVSKPVTITAWMPASGNYVDSLAGQVARFQQSQDKVRVNVEPSGTTDKLQAGIVSGEPPDLQQSNYIPMFMWNLQGALEAVDPY